VIKGPVLADLVDIIDGDTIRVKAYIWPNQTIETKVRIAGINAPELRAKCDREKKIAIKAKNFLKKNLSKKLFLTNLKWGKYGGRVIADVTNFDKRNVFDEMLKLNLAVKYDPRKKRKSWCLITLK
jgi:endonuclease YncB( thermonuclease family)